MTSVRFAIIGCGKIAQRHAEQIHRTGVLVAVCDVIQQKANSLAASYQVRAWYDVDDLLNNEQQVDVMVVCTPNGLHTEHTIKSLRAGFHVLCEKPMALRSADARRMIEEASQAGKQLFIVKQNRYNPPVLAVKKALEEGRLGALYSFQLNCFWNRDADYYKDPWRGTLLLDGGTLFTQFSHFIDLLYWIAGDIEFVNAYMGNYAHQGIIEFEDTGIVILKLHSGVIGALNYTVNCFQQNFEGSLSLFGEKGTVKIGGQYLNELEYQSIADYKISGLVQGNNVNDYGKYKGSMSNHDKVYENVLGVLQRNIAPSPTAEEGLKTVEIIEKIYQAATRL